jgi:hypothetical protein
VVEKDRSAFVNKPILMKTLPQFYQTHFQSQLARAHFLILEILINLLQSQKQVRLERLARVFPCPITLDSRRRKLQRFLDEPQLTIPKIWFPLITYWLNTYCTPKQVLYITIDRTQWGCVNLLMVSMIWDKRAIPLYWELLPKLGSSDWEEQKAALRKVLPLFKGYKVVVLGDREFCSVDLGNWLRTECVYFCLRLKRNEFIQLEGKIWLRLDCVGLVPGVSLYFQGVKVTKTKGFAGVNVACKWKRKYHGWVPEEGWFILTNLQTLGEAIAAYKNRFGIEEMFRDCKSGGYNLEGTGVSGERLITMILLIAIAYSSAVIQGGEIKQMGVQKYVARLKEPGRTQRRRSTFGVGLDGQTWVNSIEEYAEPIKELMSLSRNKRDFYQRGLRAAKLIITAA